jgi:hypothetical protein
LDESSNHKPLDSFGRYQLLDALFGRRSRRFGVGMEISSGPLEYYSRVPPLPLSELERTTLVLCGAGVSGWATGIESGAIGEAQTGCNHALRLNSRTFPGLGATGATELLFSDDRGTSATRFRDLEPARWNELAASGGFAALVDSCSPHCERLSDRRAPIAAISSAVGRVESWCFNRPGTTLFVPIVDMTQNMLNRLSILLAAGTIIHDSAHGRACGDIRKSGDSARRVALAEVERHVLENAAGEAAIVCHNIALACEAIGLGGWMFTADNPSELAAAFSPESIRGRGIRSLAGRAGESDPVGIDGCFETLCPPYFTDMREAVARFVDLKFGPGGAYDPYEYRGPYRNSWRVKVAAERFSPALIERLTDVAGYIHGAYERFPATIPAVYLRAGIQAHHIDSAFYDRFFGAGSYLASHREHMQNWHDAKVSGPPSRG